MLTCAGFLAGYGLRAGVVYDGVNIAAALFTDAPSPRTTFFFHSTSDQDCLPPAEEASAPRPQLQEWRDARGQLGDLGDRKSNCTFSSGRGYNAVFSTIKDVPTQAACCQLCMGSPQCVVSAWHPPDYDSHGRGNVTRKACFLHALRTTFTSPATAGVIGCDTGRPNGPPPPPAPPRYCRPRVMAVRKGAYKLHMWTKGAHRPAVKRADWPPAGVKVGTGYPDWMLAQPLTNWTHAPVLFDLHQDCGETVPRFPCAWDGSWPDKSGSWVSGCMPAAEYARVVADLTATYDAHLESFPFVVSQTAKGLSPARFPCCNAGCSPAPDCCHCESAGQRHLAEHLGI